MLPQLTISWRMIISCRVAAIQRMVLKEKKLTTTSGQKGINKYTTTELLPKRARGEMRERGGGERKKERGRGDHTSHEKLLHGWCWQG